MDGDQGAPSRAGRGAGEPATDDRAAARSSGRRGPPVARGGEPGGDRVLRPLLAAVGTDCAAGGGGGPLRSPGPRRSLLRHAGSRDMARRHGRRTLRLPASAVSRDARGERCPGIEAEHLQLRIGAGARAGLRRALVRARGRAGRALRGGRRSGPRGSLSAVGRADRRGPLRVRRGARPTSRRGSRCLADVVPITRPRSRGAARCRARSVRCAWRRGATRRRRWSTPIRGRSSSRAGPRRSRRPSRSSGASGVLHLTRAELDRALELAERIRTIAEASGDRLMRPRGSPRACG